MEAQCRTLCEETGFGYNWDKTEHGYLCDCPECATADDCEADDEICVSDGYCVDVADESDDFEFGDDSEEEYDDDDGDRADFDETEYELYDDQNDEDYERMTPFVTCFNTVPKSQKTDTF